MTRQILNGRTDVSVVIRIVDATDGTPETGVVFDTAGMDLKYRREGAANVDITEATLAALTTAHTDGGFLHIGNGYYRLDLPDAACAVGVVGVVVHGTVTGMVVIGEYIELVSFDSTDSVRLGLSAIPSASPGATGGLFIAGTNAATTITTGLTTTFTGNLTGSVASVTGAVGSVTGLTASNLDVAVSTRLAPTTAGRTLDVTAAGEAGIDWANIGSPTTAVNLSATNIDVDQIVASVSGAVGSVTAAITLPTIPADWITAAGIATDAFGALELAAGAAAEIADAVWDEDATGHQTQGSYGQAIGDPVADTNTIYKAVVTDAAGATIGVDIVEIEGQTDDIGAAGAGLTGVPWNAAWDAEVQSEVDDSLNTALSDSVPADGSIPSLKQAAYMITQFLYERAVSSTTVTVKKVDGSTSLLTLTLNDATTPTSITRTT